MTAIVKTVNTKTFWWIIALLLCVFLYFPPSSIAINGFDFYESYVVWQYLRPSPFSSLFRMDAIAERALNGLSLNYLALSELNIFSIIYSAFPKYLATAIQLSLQMLLFFWTSIEILQRVLPKHTPGKIFVAGITALLMSLIFINPTVIASVIGANIILLGMMRVHANPEKFSNIWYFIAAPFIAQSPLGPIFYYPIFIFFSLFWLRGDALKKALFFLMVSLFLTFIVDYRLYLTEIFNAEKTARDLWLEAPRGNPFAGLFNASYWVGAVKNGIDFFLVGQVHYNWNPKGAMTWLIAIGGGFFAFTAIISRIFNTGMWTKEVRDQLKFFGITFAILVILSLAYGILYSSIIDFWALLNSTLQVQRAAMVLMPIAGSMAVAASISLLLISLRHLLSTGIMSSLREKTKGLEYLVISLLMASASLGSSDQLMRKIANYQHFITNGFSNPYIPYYTLATSYEEGLFDSIKSFLGENWQQEITLSVGIDPMVASFNGFRHLDGNFQIYPASYKTSFRRVIAPELEKDPSNKNYFDGWGLRVYAFATRFEEQKQLIDLDGCALQQLGGTLVISRREIANPDVSGISLLGSVKGITQGLEGQAYLYRVKSNFCPITE